MTGTLATCSAHNDIAQRRLPVQRSAAQAHVSEKTGMPVSVDTHLSELLQMWNFKVAHANGFEQALPAV